MLHVSLILAGVLGVSPLTTASDPAASVDPDSRTVPVEERSVVALSRAFSEASRRAAADDRSISDLATADLAKLYEEVMQASHLPQREQERLRIRIRTRLMQLSRDLQLRIARQENAAAKRRPAADMERAGAIQAQQFGAQRPGMPMGLGMQQPPNAAQQRADHGQELVDLIQRTIAPESWDVNGGVGTIVYWPNFQALIVRQRGEVHGNLGGLLNGLRK